MRAFRSLPSPVDFGKRLSAYHRLRALGNDIRAGAGMVVAALDQQPLRRIAATGALQGKPAVKLLTVQHDHGVAPVKRLGQRHPPALLVGPAVPDDHTAAVAGALEAV